MQLARKRICLQSPIKDFAQSFAFSQTNFSLSLSTFLPSPIQILALPYTKFCLFPNKLQPIHVQIFAQSYQIFALAYLNLNLAPSQSSPSKFCNIPIQSFSLLLSKFQPIPVQVFALPHSKSEFQPNPLQVLTLFHLNFGQACIKNPPSNFHLHLQQNLFHIILLEAIMLLHPPKSVTG